MEKKRTTLPEFIRSKEQKTTVIWKSNDEDIVPENWDEMDETQRLMYFYKNRHAKICTLNVTIRDGKMFVYVLNKTIERTGRKVIQKKWSNNIIFAEGKNLKVNNKELLSQHIVDILEHFGFFWASELIQKTEDIYRHQLIKPSMLKAVLINSIYNEETLVKRIATQVYHIKAEWKLFRDFLKAKAYDFAINDLADFTKDINHSFKEIIKAKKESDKERLSIMKDILENATILGMKVNFRWSTKRMNNEHLAMVRKMMEADFENMSEEPIYDNFIDSDSIRTLKTEKEVFIEGKIMNHCLYVNYFRDIKDKSYMAFHMTSPEVCTIGIKIGYEGQPVIDQIRLRRNELCKPETTEIVKTFVCDNTDYLMSVLQPSELPF